MYSEDSAHKFCYNITGSPSTLTLPTGGSPALPADPPKVRPPKKRCGQVKSTALRGVVPTVPHTRRQGQVTASGSHLCTQANDARKGITCKICYFACCEGYTTYVDVHFSPEEVMPFLLGEWRMDMI